MIFNLFTFWKVYTTKSVYIRLKIGFFTNEYINIYTTRIFISKPFTYKKKRLDLQDFCNMNVFSCVYTVYIFCYCTEKLKGKSRSIIFLLTVKTSGVVLNMLEKYM